MKYDIKNIIKKISPYSIITILVFLIYLNSLQNGLQLDDNHTILNNPTIGYLKKFLEIDRWLIPFYNRQLAYLTFTLNFLLGGYNVLVYHLTNVLIHLINSLLVYWFINLLFNSTLLLNSKIFIYKRSIALFTALIFAVHPIQVQVVTYITQRMVSLAILFYLLSLCFYLKGRYLQINLPDRKIRFLFFTISFLSFILGIFSKEIIYSLPLSIILLEIIFLRPDNSRLSNKFVVVLSSVVILGILWVIFIYGIPVQQDAPSIYNYFLTELRVLKTYIRLLFLPINQHLFYHYEISKSFFETRVLVSSFLLIITIIIAIYLRKKEPLISFSILWFYVLLSIESSIIPLKFVIFEYRLYPVTIGFGLMISTLIYKYIPKRKNLVEIILGTVVIILSLLTINQNFYWKDGITLWQQNIEAAPLNPVPYNNLGTYYYTKKEYDLAIKQFTKAIELDSNYAEAYNHRGLCFRERNMFLSSLADFNKAIKLNHKNPLYLNNKGYTLQGMGLIDSAIYYYKRAISYYPKYHNALNNLSIAFQEKQLPDSALIYVNRALKINPYNSRYYNNRGNIYFALGDFSNARLNFLKALEIEPFYAKALNNFATILIIEKNYEKAIELLTFAIKQDPEYPDPLFNRGLSYMSLGKYEMAEKDFYKCLTINPKHQGAKECLKLISSKL